MFYDALPQIIGSAIAGGFWLWAMTPKRIRPATIETTVEIPEPIEPEPVPVPVEPTPVHISETEELELEIEVAESIGNGKINPLRSQIPSPTKDSTRDDLRLLARLYNVPRYSRLSKTELYAALEALGVL